MNSTFEIAQALRRSHCDLLDKPHECVGEVTIKRGEVCLNCARCGKGEERPHWNHQIANELQVAFKAAGFDWSSMNVESQVMAIMAVERHRNRQ